MHSMHSGPGRGKQGSVGPRLGLWQSSGTEPAAWEATAMPRSFKLAFVGLAATEHRPSRGKPAALVAVLIAAAACLPMSMAATSTREGHAVPAAVERGPATAGERAALVKRFVSKWGGYAEEVYGVDGPTWRDRMARDFAHGDADNLREALRRDTFEGAMAALGGGGHRLDDDRVIDKLAAAADAGKAGEIPAIGMALGALDQDLVFTPIQPCRIVDTRNIGVPLGAGQNRGFPVAGVDSFTNLGGSSSDCGMQAEVPSAVVLNVTAVRPVQDGFATVYPSGAPRPGTASVNYTAGAIVNNTVITKIINPASSSDFVLYTYADSHFVVDLVGYFAAPRTTALSCVDSGLATTTIGVGQTGQVTAPSCPAGYTAIQLDCESGSWLMPIVFSSLRGGGICGARNGGSTSSVLSAARRCCRVPGR